ncbi:type I secretion system permease/ATPase [Novosphingobium flavum]|uniref:Type I secretion system permease/ATPase n=1 Tax=Novosphingobium flavum TaxID=1778672 RepID=A0A7X1FUL5_9SPHN|nr:type I secretion system permease/ATPase [Novosphingobium flavum]MBC2667285.1 type I secretion system permease/ATPase [Novosphingobium flavum]
MSGRQDLSGAIAACLARRGRSASAAVIHAAIGPAPDRAAVLRGLAEIGITAQWLAPEALAADMMPAVAVLAEGGACAVGSLGELAGLEGAAIVLVFAEAAAADGRADDLVVKGTAHWFWPVLWSYRRYYFEAAAQSAVINLLSLAGIIFTMTVYDRILPNQAFVTLWSLLVGVVLAMGFEFAARTLRSHVLDAAGKKIDLVLGDTVFFRALSIRLEHRAQSSGAFANILKEFEAVRGFVTSATLVAIADLPFALLFLGVCALVGGWLVVVPLLAFVIVAVLSLAIQVPMARLANESLREAAVRHGTVIESLEGLETLKALGAEGRMRRRHELSSAVVADRAVRSQSWSNLVVNLTVLLQQAASALLLAWGVYLASVGMATAGALVACVQLSSRALAPLVTLTSLAVRFQQVRSALRSLDAIMALPVEREPERTLISGPDWAGAVELQGASFRYEREGQAAIDTVSLSIAPGERVAILGRIGSGKSTLLRLIAGLLRPGEGQVLLDGVDMTAIEPADLRAAVLLVGQDARLFHGTLRDNITLAAAGADDQRMLEVAEATGAAAIAAGHPLGFDRPVGERGDTLSGGQRQAVAMARALMARPRLYLLDEPTSAMDQQTEAELLRTISTLGGEGTGFVIVTHKQTVLPHVDRIIVMDGGRIVADGPRDGVINALSEGRVRSVA